MSPIPQSEILEPLDILQLRGNAQVAFHERAAKIRNDLYGRQVFIRGVVEVSNFCRQNCNYCGMRRDNRDLERYRVSKEEILDLIFNHLPSCVTDINIQAGEDPIAVREVVIPLIQEIRKSTNLGVSVCLGMLSPKEYKSLQVSGSNFYILKLETGDEQHYRDVQAPGTLARRVEAIRHLAATGWKVSSGLILGLPGQTTEILSKTLNLLKDLPLTGCSVSPFISGNQTPFSESNDGGLESALNCVAWMRLTTPERIIPAVSAMGLVGENGYTQALQAGANLATINLTPPDLRKNYLLYKRERLIMNEERVLGAIERAGCRPSEVGLAEFLSPTIRPAMESAAVVRASV